LSIPLSSDIAIVIPEEAPIKLPWFQIKTEEEMRKISAYDDICICSYPGGDQSLDITKKYGLRLKPLMQFGRISRFVPSDQSLVSICSSNRYNRHRRLKRFPLQTSIGGTISVTFFPLWDLTFWRNISSSFENLCFFYATSCLKARTHLWNA
jgi:hypothetical protein